MSPIFAHRGCQTKAPENSLQAFKNAIELGVYGIELDVQMTKDKEIVVHHNPNTKKLTGIDLDINNSTLSQVKKLRLSNDETIPKLQEVFDLIKGKCVCIIDFRRYDAIEKIISIVKSYSMEKEVIFSCDDEKILKKSKELCPEIKREFLASAFLSKGVSIEKAIEMAKGCDAFLISVRHYILTKGIVEIAHKNNLKINSLVELDKDIKKVKNYKVDYIMSNYPDKLLKII